jgi:hypothetical protein
MPTTRRFFRLGALTLIAGGLAHFALVDLATLWLRTGISHWSPFSPLPVLEHSTLDFGLLGHAGGFRALAGFSFWVGVSLVLVGTLYLLLAGQPQLGLRKFTLHALVLSVCFGAVAAVCFIEAAAVGAAFAVVFFATSLVRREA